VAGPGGATPDTGVSAVIVPAGAIGSVDVRGAAPGTRETDALGPLASGERVHAVLFVGRSVFGLAAADGAVEELERRGIGLPIAWDERRAVIPIVAAAVLFDLGHGDPARRPRPADGRRAVRSALDGPRVRPDSGSVGAGVGAWTGGITGERRKGGLGHASLSVVRPGGELVVGAMVVVNAAGEVRPDGRFGGPGPVPALDDIAIARGQTTLAVIATNARLTKAQLAQVAAMGHDGLARTIRPVHSGVDGDAVFALGEPGSTTEAHPWGPAAVTIVGSLAADAVARAVGDAMRAAGPSGLVRPG
jgi:L-aminopeptidase/D-esterase-like protein